MYTFFEMGRLILVVLLWSMVILSTGCAGVPKTKSFEIFANGVEATAKAVGELHKLELASLYNDELTQDIKDNLLDNLTFNQSDCEKNVKECVVKYTLENQSVRTLGPTSKMESSHKKILSEILLYAKLLELIATTDNVKSFDEQIKALRDTTDSIYDTLKEEEQVNDEENPEKKNSYASYMNLTEKIVTFIGNQYINYKRMAVLREAIDKGYTIIPPALEFLEEMVNSMRDIVVNDVTIRFELETIEVYNKGNHPGTGERISDTEHRRTALEYVIDDLNVVRTKLNSNPIESINNIKSYMNKLKKEIDEESVNFSQFITDAQKFYKEASDIHDALEEL